MAISELEDRKVYAVDIGDKQTGDLGWIEKIAPDASISAAIQKYKFYKIPACYNLANLYRFEPGYCIIFWQITTGLFLASSGNGVFKTRMSFFEYSREYS